MDQFWCPKIEYQKRECDGENAIAEVRNAT
jgi:hypothetical protein